MCDNLGNTRYVIKEVKKVLLQCVNKFGKLITCVRKFGNICYMYREAGLINLTKEWEGANGVKRIQGVVAT